MSGNAQKTSFGQSLRQFGRGVAKNAGEVAGKFLPASLKSVSGTTAKVNYDVTGDRQYPTSTLPIMTSKYVRIPYQSGAKGMTTSADAYMGGVSGLGGGSADQATEGNLTTGVWMPVGDTAWAAVDPNTLVMFGESGGVTLRDSEGGSSVINITSTAINLTAGGHTIVINSTGVIIDGKVFLLHTHKDTQPGGGNSGPPT